MPATDDQLKRMILDRIGDSPLAAQVIDGFWLARDGYASYSGLRSMYVLRDLLTVVMASERTLVDTRRDGDRSVSLNQRFQHLESLYAFATSEINELMQQLTTVRSGGGAIGKLTTTTFPPWRDPFTGRLYGEGYL